MNCYKKLCTEFYDIDKPKALKEEYEFYLRYVHEAKGPVLEPMCGSGRFLIPLLEAGYEIDGIDASPYMLQSCKDKCKKGGYRTNLYEQYLHQIELPRQYSLVFINSGSFSLITGMEQVRESLRRIYGLMFSGGKFVVEINHKKPKESSAWPWGGRWVRRSDGAKIIISWLGHYDAENSITNDIHRYELVKEGKLLETEFEDFNRRFYDFPEFCELLQEAGFKNIKKYKTYAFQEPDEKDEDIVIECTKL